MSENAKVTGWPPGLLQDDCRKLSRWFASRLDARRRVREVAAEIRASIARRSGDGGGQHG